MDKLYYVGQHAHAGWRWIVLILLIFAVVKMNIGWKKKGQEFTEKDRKLALFTMIAFHIQVLVGFVLFFISPKVQFISGMMGNKLLRFFTVEHSVMMLIAMALITIGHAKSKKKENATEKFKAIAVFYTIAFVIILAAIPWPFREALGGKWF